MKDSKGKITKLPSSFEIKNKNGIELENFNESNFRSSYLNVPDANANKKKIKLDGKTRYQVLNSVDLTNWLCVYHDNNYGDADGLYNSMLAACKDIGIKVAEPTWVNLASKRYEDWLYEVENKDPSKKQVVIFVLDRSLEGLYKRIKQHSLCNLGYKSQVVKTQSLRKNALSVCSNLLKQINVKLGGASYSVDYDQSVKVIYFKIILIFIRVKI